MFYGTQGLAGNTRDLGIKGLCISCYSFCSPVSSAVCHDPQQLYVSYVKLKYNKIHVINSWSAL